MSSSHNEIRMHNVPKGPNESRPEYMRRAEEINDARKCRRLWFDQHVDLKLIAVRVGRPLEWVREVVAYRRHGAY